MMLTSLNNHLQAVKRAKQIKKYLYLIFKYDREKRKEIEKKFCLYDY